MTGRFRFFLACLVLISHFSGAVYFRHYGYYAVRAFFVMSGFVITSALHEAYHFDAGRFWANRLLRLMPQYLLVCFATLLVIWLYPVETTEIISRWRSPGLFPVMENIALIPLAFSPPSFQVIMPAWSIAVELVMYLLLFLYMARSAPAAIVCLAIGTAYHVWAMAVGLPFEHRYFLPASAMFSFALGSLIYFWKSRKVRTIKPAFAYAALLCWITNLVAAGGTFSVEYEQFAGYYLNTLLSVAVVATLPALKASTAGRRIDQFFGDLAYPLFLVHWLVFFLLHAFIAPNVKSHLVMIVYVFLMSCALSMAMNYLQQKLVEPLRRKIRSADEQTLLAPMQQTGARQAT